MSGWLKAIDSAAMVRRIAATAWRQAVQGLCRVCRVCRAVDKPTFPRRIKCPCRVCRVNRGEIAQRARTRVSVRVRAYVRARGHGHARARARGNFTFTLHTLHTLNRVMKIKGKTCAG